MSLLCRIPDSTTNCQRTGRSSVREAGWNCDVGTAPRRLVGKNTNKSMTQVGSWQTGKAADDASAVEEVRTCANERQMWNALQVAATTITRSPWSHSVSHSHSQQYYDHLVPVLLYLKILIFVICAYLLVLWYTLIILMTLSSTLWTSNMASSGALLR